ncbi:uncharacterized protein V6R79_016518 [Siganus canaliculatus]
MAPRNKRLPVSEEEEGARGRGGVPSRRCNHRRDAWYYAPSKSALLELPWLSEFSPSPPFASRLLENTELSFAPVADLAQKGASSHRHAAIPVSMRDSQPL